MTPINVKQKGNDFERDAVAILTEKVKSSTWKRIPSSGAIGTNMHEPTLTGDINGTIESFPKKFKVEAKVGYGGAKQFGLKKEWLDKIKEEADLTFSTPMVVGKFSGARTGTRVFVVLDVDVFAELINHATYLKEQLDKLTK